VKTQSFTVNKIKGITKNKKLSLNLQEYNYLKKL